MKVWRHHTQFTSCLFKCGDTTPSSRYNACAGVETPHPVPVMLGFFSAGLPCLLVIFPSQHFSGLLGCPSPSALASTDCTCSFFFFKLFCFPTRSSQTFQDPYPCGAEEGSPPHHCHNPQNTSVQQLPQGFDQRSR